MADEEFHTSIAFPSGRCLRALVGPEERVEILSPDGQIELRITLSPDGPVLHLQARRLELHATETLSLRSEGDMDIAAGGELRVVGARIHLN